MCFEHIMIDLRFGVTFVNDALYRNNTHKVCYSCGFAIHKLFLHTKLKYSVRTWSVKFN